MIAHEVMRKRIIGERRVMNAIEANEMKRLKKELRASARDCDHLREVNDRLTSPPSLPKIVELLDEHPIRSKITNAERKLLNTTCDMLSGNYRRV